MNEKQKKTTNDYRNNWDKIFPKKEKCCNHDCNQGRNCPNKNIKQTPKL